MIEPQTTTERRSAPRQPVSYRLDVVLRDGTVGCLLDVSEAGMRLRFKRELDLDTTEACIDLPQWLELGPRLDVRGRFVWVRRDVRGATEAGFAFDELARKEHGMLEVLVQRLAEAVSEDRAA